MLLIVGGEINILVPPGSTQCLLLVLCYQIISASAWRLYVVPKSKPTYTSILHL